MCRPQKVDRNCVFACGQQNGQPEQASKPAKQYPKMIISHFYSKPPWDLDLWNCVGTFSTYNMPVWLLYTAFWCLQHMKRQLEMRYATANAPGIWTYEIVLELPAHNKCKFDCFMQHVGTPSMWKIQLGMLYTIANAPGILTYKLLLEPPIHKTIQLWLLYTALWCLQPVNHMILKTKCNAFSTSKR